MDQIKKIIMINIPLSICNLRCHYCYLAQRKKCYQGIQPQMKYSPEEVARGLSKKRIGGPAFINICASGETLLTENLDQYVKALLEEGHYIAIVTNMTVAPMLDKILALDKRLLKHLEFKCSFHYLELKSKGLLDLFTNNVNKIWSAGASANIEITPSDELIPYIDELKSYSLKEFGALPHVTIARNDGDSQIGYLTKLPMEKYDQIWSQFHSPFWEYKKTIFGVKQKGFCYAGKWSLFVNLATGIARQCYRGVPLGDIFKNPDKPLPDKPICKCSLAHCYNGHALLTLGVIPDVTDVGFGDIRNRVREDGTEWLQPELKEFYNGKLKNANELYSPDQKKMVEIKNLPLVLARNLLIAMRTMNMKKMK